MAPPARERSPSPEEGEVLRHLGVAAAVRRAEPKGLFQAISVGVRERPVPPRCALWEETRARGRVGAKAAAGS